MWLRTDSYNHEGRSLDAFELELTQNCITGQDSLCTSHQSLAMRWIIRDL